MNQSFEHSPVHRHVYTMRCLYNEVNFLSKSSHQTSHSSPFLKFHKRLDFVLIYWNISRVIICQKLMPKKDSNVSFGVHVGNCPITVQGTDLLNDDQLLAKIRHTNHTMPQSHIPQCTTLLQKCAHVCTFLLQSGALWDISLMHSGFCYNARPHRLPTSSPKWDFLKW